MLSVVGGYLGIPNFLGQHHGALHWNVIITSTAVVAVGLFLAWLIYRRKAVSAEQIVQALALPDTLVQNRFYIDVIYTWIIMNVQQKLIAGSCALFERYIIIGLAVNGTAWLTRGFGQVIRLCQTGKVQTYVLVFLIGVVWLLSTALAR